MSSWPSASPPRSKRRCGICAGPAATWSRTCTRARNRLLKFLLRHSRVWRGGSNWTVKHEAWLTAQSFDESALQTTFEHYRAVVLSRDAALAAVEADLAVGSTRRPSPIRCVAWPPTGG